MNLNTIKNNSNIIVLFTKLFHKLFDNQTDYARFLGVKIGKYSTIGMNVIWPSEPYLITIGEHVQVTNGVRIHTHGGGQVLRCKYPDFDCFGKVVIEDWAYIGSGSQIMPGVTIGEGCLVAAGSVVTKSTPPHMVVGGNPARVLCTIDEYAEKNMKYDTHTKGLDYKKKKLFLVSLEDDMFIKK